MKIKELSIKGAFLIELDIYCDNRGSFTRHFCKKELAAVGVDFDIKQCNISTNTRAGTLRGLHYQKHPYEESKLVSCFSGACFDVIVDIDKKSSTYLKWESVELSEDRNVVIYVPPTCAHGFQTIKDNTFLYYQLNEYFKPEYYSGFRWNDPKIGIKWPQCQNRIINERDDNYGLI